MKKTLIKYVMFIILILLGYSMSFFNKDAKETFKLLKSLPYELNENNIIKKNILEQKTEQNNMPKSSKSETITKEQAVNLVKAYLEEKVEYIPSIIEVDSEETERFLVHSYDIIGQGEETHTATSGWYYVNKYTGEVKSMF
jgi:hypothetical protein